MTPMMDFPLGNGAGETYIASQAVYVVMYLCPPSLVFLAIAFEKIKIFKCDLFYCILHEMLHQIIYSMTVLFRNTRIKKFLACSGITPVCILGVTCTP